MTQHQLVMRTGPTPGKVFELTQAELTLGREPGNDIVINDGEISRKHARLSLQGDTYMLEDLGSTNGTFVNGQRLMGQHELRPGEIIAFGEQISCTYDQISERDPNATIISSKGSMATMAPTPQPAAPPPPPPTELAQSMPPSQPKPAATPAPSQPRPAAVPAALGASQPKPAVPPASFAGKVPAGPEKAAAKPPAKRSSSRTIIIIVAVVILCLLCSCIVFFYAVDRNSLWCNVLPWIVPILGGSCP
jgi:predicted component of type VI protein secretion system